MKKLFSLTILCLAIISCQDELDIPLSSLTTDDVTPNAAFVETLVVGAYAAQLSGGWQATETNWTYSDVASDDAYKGSDATDQSDITQFETWNTLPSNGFLDSKWTILYEGISRVNAAIVVIQNAIESGDLSEAEANPALGEVLFLRAHYHFEARKIFGNIPYIIETTTEAPDNTIDSWPLIEADMETAISLLTEDVGNNGRANRWTAKAYMAKIHMFQLDYAAALPFLNDVIDNGPYMLNPIFHDNFNAATNNSNPEVIFAVKYAINDGAGGLAHNNSAYANVLNYPHSNSPFGCCGFFQPSHDLVNAYLVDPTTGLPAVGEDPISDPALYVASVDPNDVVGTDADGNPIPRNADDATFVPETRPLDPRLDWTVGRRGIPFNGWGDFGGLLWIRDASNGGPFMAKKHVWENSQDGTGGITGNWGQKLTTINHNVIRLAEVILWRAEVAAANGDLGTAATLVDLIRARSADPSTFVLREDGTPAANYMLGLYTDNGGFPDQDFAEAAIVYEHRLEMAMEGHRFFDLARRGLLMETMNSYVNRPQFRGYLTNATFVAGREIYPIPTDISDLSNGAFTQNPSY